MSETNDQANVVVLRGRLSRDPEVRALPSGSILHRYDVTIRRPDAGAETAPVAWIDPVRPPKLSAGDDVVVVGRVRRRFYRSGGATLSATEVTADVVVRASSRARASRAIDDAWARLTGG